MKETDHGSQYRNSKELYSNKQRNQKALVIDWYMYEVLIERACTELVRGTFRITCLLLVRSMDLGFNGWTSSMAPSRSSKGFIWISRPISVEP